MVYSASYTVMLDILLVLDTPVILSTQTLNPENPINKIVDKKIISLKPNVNGGTFSMCTLLLSEARDEGCI